MSKEEFRELVGIAIGEASVCWSELPGGVFESTRAIGIIDRIVLASESELEKARAEIERWERQEMDRASCCWAMEQERDSLREALEKSLKAWRHMVSSDLEFVGEWKELFERMYQARHAGRKDGLE